MPLLSVCMASASSQLVVYLQQFCDWICEMRLLRTQPGAEGGATTIREMLGRRRALQAAAMYKDETALRTTKEGI